jgi:predicted RNase H-like HicB family nuclease
VTKTTERLPVVLSEGEDGWILATCPVIPGCHTQGRTREEALANAREAIALCLEGQHEEGWELPKSYELLDVSLSEVRA